MMLNAVFSGHYRGFAAFVKMNPSMKLKEGISGIFCCMAGFLFWGGGGERSEWSFLGLGKHWWEKYAAVKVLIKAEIVVGALTSCVEDED